jgi:2-keto-3-deoxy-L-rhamnonate aldolase RhmA
MPTIPNLRELVKTRDRVLSSVLIGQLCDPKIVEIMGLSGLFDIVWFDQEHVGLTIPEIEHAARAARAVGVPSFVRLYAQNHTDVMRPLEAGSDGIMAAMVKSAAETAKIVEWARFWPEGLRGVNGSGVDGRFGGYSSRDDYSREANRRAFVAIQIETAEAVAEVEAIAKVPGVDMLFVGPADLSQALGIPGQFDHPKLWEAVDRVAAACSAADIPWSALAVGVPMADEFVKRGCRFLTHSVDVWLVRSGLTALEATWRETFGRRFDD